MSTSESPLDKVVRLSGRDNLTGGLVKLQEVVALSDRHVKTPEGAEHFGKPIGARIGDTGALGAMGSGAKITSFDKQRKTASHFTKHGQKWKSPGYGDRKDADFEYDIKSPGKELMEGHMKDASHLDAPAEGEAPAAPQEKASPVKPGGKVNSADELAEAPVGTKINIEGTVLEKKANQKWYEAGSKVGSSPGSMGVKTANVKWA